MRGGFQDHIHKPIALRIIHDLLDHTYRQPPWKYLITTRRQDLVSLLDALVADHVHDFGPSLRIPTQNSANPRRLHDDARAARLIVNLQYLGRVPEHIS